MPHRKPGPERGLPEGTIVVIVFGVRTLVPAVSKVGEHRDPCVGWLRAIRSRLVVAFLAAFVAPAGYVASGLCTVMDSYQQLALGDPRRGTLDLISNRGHE
jgi:hypothetical protein